MKVSASAIAFEEDGLWIAQGVEFDIVATASRLEDLPKAFAKAVAATVAANRHLGREGLNGFPAAPDKFREAFESSAFGLLPGGSFETPDVSVRDLRIASNA